MKFIKKQHLFILRGYMGNNCIFCDSNEISAEHIFPSSFGGKLTNKKIYCKKHNSDLGVYVNVLDSQIGAINNLFGISPDRGKPKPIELKDPKTGDIYLRQIDGNVTLHPIYNLDDNAIINDKCHKIILSSKDDFNKVKKYFEKKHKIKIELRGESKVHSEIIKNHLQLQIQFGGKDFFKASLYLIVTFLAHYDRKSLESIYLRDIKDILLNNKDDDIFDIVSLSSHPMFLKDIENSVCHSLAFIRKDGILYGIISYFNVVSYTIEIGKTSNNFNNFVVYFYPLNESKNPNDSMIKEELPSCINFDFNPNLHQEKIHSIIKGDFPIMDKLCSKLNIVSYSQRNISLRDKINAIKEKDKLNEFWINNKQEIYNSILSLISKEGSFEDDNIVIKYLKSLINNNFPVDKILNKLKSTLSVCDIEKIKQIYKINVFSLDSFINEICLNLADYYLTNRIKEDEDFLLKITKEILSLAVKNLEKINHKFK